MKILLEILTVAVLMLISPAQVLAETQVIYAGQLLAIPGKAPKNEQTIVIENDKIVEVLAGYVDKNEFDEKASVIDLKNSFVMPGLMDMHVHLQGELGPKNDSEDLKMSAELKGMRSIYFGMLTLMAGFTTVRDVGSDSQTMYALRD